MNLGFIGLGKLGLPCAEVMALQHNVEGYDIAILETVNVSIADTIEQVVKGKDIVFIVVPTPHDPAYDGRTPSGHLEPKDFSYDIVKECIIEANKYMTKDQLLVLISTVLPGTTRREFIPLITNTRFIYNPYLIAMGSVSWDMVNPEMVMIGTEDGSETGDAKMLVDFYKTIMENDPRYEIGTWDECEAIKVFYNTFISAKIGIVNMIQDVAEKQGNINVDVVTNALAKSSMRIMGPQYMTAGMGDGGGCVLPSFKINVNDQKITISQLHDDFDKNKIFLVDSATYSCNVRDQKKIHTVPVREYNGKMIKITTEFGKVLHVTQDHLVPVLRDNERILIKASDIKLADKLFIV